MELHASASDCWKHEAWCVVQVSFVLIRFLLICPATAAPARQTTFSNKMATDRDVLVTLYRSTEGANWKEKDNWDTDAALSMWYGVKVDVKGRVVALDLDDNNLEGTSSSRCDVRNCPRKVVPLSKQLVVFFS